MGLLGPQPCVRWLRAWGPSTHPGGGSPSTGATHQSIFTKATLTSVASGKELLQSKPVLVHCVFRPVCWPCVYHSGRFLTTVCNRLFNRRNFCPRSRNIITCDKGVEFHVPPAAWLPFPTVFGAEVDCNNIDSTGTYASLACTRHGLSTYLLGRVPTKALSQTCDSERF